MGSERKSKEKEEDKRNNKKKRSSFDDSEDEGKSKRPRSVKDEEAKSSKSERKDPSKKKSKSHKSSKHHSDKEKKSKEKQKQKSKRDKHDGQFKIKFQELSNDDYFSKNNEFSTWLKEEKNVFFSDLSTETARDRFSQFVKAWNSQQLESRYYEGIETGPRTAHKWRIKQ